MKTRHYLHSVGMALAFVSAVLDSAAAQSRPAPSNAMELAVVLANAKVPAGMVVPDLALSRYQTVFATTTETAEAVSGGLSDTVKRLDTPLQLRRVGDVWMMQAENLPPELEERLQRPRYLAAPLKSTAYHAILNFVGGLLQDKEITGVVGAGIHPDQRCPLQATVELVGGPTSVVQLLNDAVRQVPGLVWVVSYAPEGDGKTIGIVCPGGQYLKVMLL